MSYGANTSRQRSAPQPETGPESRTAPHMLFKVDPQRTGPTERLGLETPCCLPLYSYSVRLAEIIDVPGGANVTESAKAKVKDAMHALTHEIVKHRLDHIRDEGNSHLIHRTTDFDSYRTLLSDAASQTKSFLRATGPLDESVIVTIVVTEGETRTASNCNHQQNWLGGEPEIEHTALVHDLFFSRLRSLWRAVKGAKRSTNEAWINARRAAGRELAIPTGQSLVTEEALKRYALSVRPVTEEDEENGEHANTNDTEQG